MTVTLLARSVGRERETVAAAAVVGDREARLVAGASEARARLIGAARPRTTRIRAAHCAVGDGTFDPHALSTDRGGVTARVTTHLSLERARTTDPPHRRAGRGAGCRLTRPRGRRSAEVTATVGTWRRAPARRRTQLDGHRPDGAHPRAPHAGRRIEHVAAAVHAHARARAAAASIGEQRRVRAHTCVTHGSVHVALVRVPAATARDERCRDEERGDDEPREEGRRSQAHARG